MEVQLVGSRPDRRHRPHAPDIRESGSGVRRFGGVHGARLVLCRVDGLPGVSAAGEAAELGAVRGHSGHLCGPDHPVCRHRVQVGAGGTHRRDLPLHCRHTAWLVLRVQREVSDGAQRHRGAQPGVHDRHRQQHRPHPLAARLDHPTVEHTRRAEHQRPKWRPCGDHSVLPGAVKSLSDSVGHSVVHHQTPGRRLIGRPQGHTHGHHLRGQPLPFLPPAAVTVPNDNQRLLSSCVCGGRHDLLPLRPRQAAAQPKDRERPFDSGLAQRIRQRQRERL
mmetsp:Transcript_5957/g.16910  ORF Transcript_5957/g.16910 Transcript_5957/m.16910 type:complete len:277 (+) Transcript_5957:306-1136(+)